MKHKSQISYALCGAITLSLSASISAQQGVTHILAPEDKVLLMEVIHVTSAKDIAEEDLTSSDPEVDQVLRLIDGLTIDADDLTEETDSTETNAEGSDASGAPLPTAADADTNRKVQNDNKTDTAQLDLSKAIETDPERTVDSDTVLSNN